MEAAEKGEESVLTFCSKHPLDPYRLKQSIRSKEDLDMQYVYCQTNRRVSIVLSLTDVGDRNSIQTSICAEVAVKHHSVN